MTGYIKKDSHALSDLVKDAIVKMITTEKLPNNKLPAESKLAKMFGCSVAVVREALLLLSKDGVITKKQGSGNYFHLSALKSGSRIDQLPGFHKMLENEGYQVTGYSCNFRFETPGAEICEALKLLAGEEVLAYERVLHADGHPAIYCRNYIPAKLIRSAVEETEKDLPLFTVFHDNLGLEMAYGKMQFHPLLSDSDESELLKITKGRPIILMEELYYSLEDIPMGYSRNLLNDDYITVNILSR